MASLSFAEHAFLCVMLLLCFAKACRRTKSQKIFLSSLHETCHSPRFTPELGKDQADQRNASKFVVSTWTNSRESAARRAHLTLARSKACRNGHLRSISSLRRAVRRTRSRCLGLRSRAHHDGCHQQRPG